MGSRVYLPELGRFLSVDPIEGGTDNNYVYSNDPVNQTDLTGNGFETAFDIASVGYDANEFHNKPSWGNFGMLAWSVTAVVLPFVPGSYVGRAGAAAIKGTKALDKVDSVKDTAKAASKAPAPKPKPPVKKPPTQQPPKKAPKKSTSNQHRKSVRIGSGRISAGAAPKYFKKMSFREQLKHPVSVHFGKGWGGITLNWSLWWSKTPWQIRLW